MTVSTTTNRIQYNGDGTTVDFGFPYVMFAASDLLVTLYDTAAMADVSPAPVLNGSDTYDYTFAGTFDADRGEYTAGGTVTFNTAPITGYRVTIERVVPQTQAVTLIDNSKFPANTVNGALDRLTVLVQRAMQLVGQALTFPSSDPTTVTSTLPDAATRASMYLAFDASGNPIASPGPSSTGGPISAFWATTVQLANAALSRTALAINSNAFVTQASGDSTTLAATTAFVAAATAKVYVQTFSVTGTYTPHAGMVNCLIYAVGGGGGGAGVGVSAASGLAGGGGGAGSLSILLATAATIGVSKAVTIGAAGAAGATGANAGGAGGDTSVGTICIGKGGSGGGTATFSGLGGAGGVAGTGTITCTGEAGFSGIGESGSAATITSGGKGGSSMFGSGGISPVQNTGNTAGAGNAGTGRGSGGSGAANNAAGGGTTAAGGAGTAGYVYIIEFCDR